MMLKFAANMEAAMREAVAADKVFLKIFIDYQTPFQ
jgi:hypothetical protein